MSSTIRRNRNRLIDAARQLGSVIAPRRRLKSLLVGQDASAAQRLDDRRVIEASGLFNRLWYLQQNPDVAAAGVDPLEHFLDIGAVEKRKPNPGFNTHKFLTKYPGLQELGINPLAFHIRAQAGLPQPRLAAADNDQNFRSFGGFLVESLFSPLLQAPFSPGEEYILAYMESRKAQLRAKHAAKAQPYLVSVVMATYNRAHCIEEAIASLRAQSYGNWELIVVDDGGTDDTELVVQRLNDARIRFIRLDQNRGPSGARNAGLEQIQGEFVCYLDSDNVMDQDFLLILTNELSSNPDFDVVYCAQMAFHSKLTDSNVIHVRYAAFHRPTLENGNWLDLGAIMHRRSLIGRYGPYNPALRRFVDWDLLLRYTAEKSPKGVPCILSKYRYEENNRQVTFVEPADANREIVDASLQSDRVSAHLPGVSLSGIELMFSAHLPTLDVERSKIAIVIPNFEAEAYLRACVDSLYAFTSEFELIIVDNGSSKPVSDYLRDLERSGRARVVLNNANLGFTHAVNQGIALASDDSDIVILNNDAIVTRGWLDALRIVLRQHPEAGLVMPRQVVLAGERTAPIHQPERNHERECDVNISRHHANVIDPRFDQPRGYMELSYAPFFCVYVPRRTIAEIGPLDVENGPHYRSDRLYCDMVRDVLGRKIIYTPLAKVYHFVQRATVQLKDDDQNLYQKMFVNNDWKEISSHHAQL